MDKRHARERKTSMSLKKQGTTTDTCQGVLYSSQECTLAIDVEITDLNK